MPNWCVFEKIRDNVVYRTFCLAVMLVGFYCQRDTASRHPEEGTSIEDLCRLDWPVAMSVSLIMIAVRRLSQWLASLGCVRNVAEDRQMRETHTPLLPGSCPDILTDEHCEQIWL